MLDARHRLEREGLAALDRGWLVTPLEGKQPILSGWQSQSRPKPADVVRWVRRGNNLGLRTGSVSSIVVVDHDPKRDSGITLPTLPRTLTVKTGGGGRHYYYSCPNAAPKNSNGTVHPEIDIRSTGGQVVLPGSIHPNTSRVYMWESCPDEWFDGLPLYPAHLVRSSRKRSVARSTGSSRVPPLDEDGASLRASAWIDSVPGAISGQGGHNHTFYVACRLVCGFGLDEECALALLRRWNERCSPPWTEKELIHKITDAAKQPDERGYMLKATSAPPPTWIVAALSSHPKRVLVPRHVPHAIFKLLVEGTHNRYELPDGSLDVDRAAFAAIACLFRSGLSPARCAELLAASPLTDDGLRTVGERAEWLTERFLAVRTCLFPGSRGVA